MKTSFHFLILMVLVVSFTDLGAQSKAIVKAQPKVEVYYFHPEERCPIDQSIEVNTGKVMQAEFAKQVKDGTILYRVINTDDKSAAGIVSKFDINAQALYIVKMDKGKEVQKDLTKFAFDYGQSNPGKFKAGLIEEINKALK